MSSKQEDFLLDSESSGFEEALGAALNILGQRIKAYEDAAEKLEHPRVQEQDGH